MNQKALIAIALVAILLVAGVGAVVLTQNNDSNNSDNSDENGTDEVLIDFMGQEVIPVDNLDNGIVAVGQDSFRWVTYFGLADKCVMVDQNDMSNFMGKSFMYNGRAQVNIDNAATSTPEGEARTNFTHTNCGITADDVHKIIELNPSLMVVPVDTYKDFSNEVKSLEKAGINTVAIGNIYTFLKEGTFEMTDDLVKQIDILAAATGMDDRAKELKAAFTDCVNDVRSYASKVTEKRTAYVGGVAYNGAHDVSSSVAYYMPFELANVTNIIGGAGDYAGSGVKEYSAQAIKENMKDDTVLFLDASGYKSNTTQTSTGILKMFSGKDAFLIMPYIWTGMNFDSVFVDALQVLRCAYGDAVITEEQMFEEIDKVYERFYGTSDSNRNVDNPNKKPLPLPEEGTSIFEDINAMYLVAKQNPVYGEVIISDDGSLSIKP